MSTSLSSKEEIVNKRSSKSEKPAIVWFRQDLRLADNPALVAAHNFSAEIIPVFIWAPDEESEWPLGGASKWWLHKSLGELQKSLKENGGGPLIIREGGSLANLRSLIKEVGAGSVFWNRRYEPHIIERDAKIKSALQEEGCHVHSFNAALFHEPWTITNQSGRPFQVFTPFHKHCRKLEEPREVLEIPDFSAGKKESKSVALTVSSLCIDDLGLLPKIPWHLGMEESWTPGEAGAQAALDQFLRSAFGSYKEIRDIPGQKGTSKLSAALHFGEISPVQIWHRIQEYAESGKAQGGVNSRWRESHYITELYWREFSHHLIFHFPKTPTAPLRAQYEGFPWVEDEERLRIWQRGLTGYPIVDAGMRELWHTGWMHNRVRMIAGSFLVKDLLIHWLHGARWFWDTLVDADLAQNTAGWQWVAGSGADAAPYFRVFNPTLQGEKFDPKGAYIRKWIPELAGLPDKFIHRPFEADKRVLQEAGVTLGVTYPKPIVDHDEARRDALKAYSAVSQSAAKELAEDRG